MIINRIGRKIYKLTHPVEGEIWMLHRVAEVRSEAKEQCELEVTPQWLEAEINTYKQKGYRFVSLDALPCRGPWVVVTFDDGYRDNYTLAYPLLKRLGVPFTIYVTTALIDNQMEAWWYPGQALGMSLGELKALATEPLCTLGAHTVGHPKLDTLTREQQRAEIEGSKRMLEEIIGREVKHFSFPHGAHNQDTLDICNELKFCTTVKSWGGPLRRGEWPNPLPRINKQQL